MGCAPGLANACSAMLLPARALAVRALEKMADMDQDSVDRRGKYGVALPHLILQLRAPRHHPRLVAMSLGEWSFQQSQAMSLDAPSSHRNTLKAPSKCIRWDWACCDKVGYNPVTRLEIEHNQ